MSSLYLASRSPRRRQLLSQIGVSFQALSVSVDETPQPDESPAHYVERLALEKARAGWNLSATKDRWPVLGADTAVVIDGRILGKPADKTEAQSMLLTLAGTMHQVWTAVALVKGEHQRSRVVSTRVHFKAIDHAEAESYWQSGEPVDKAGGYAIQGLAAVFVDRVEGSYSGVVGLPLAETAVLLTEFGVPIWQRVEE